MDKLGEGWALVIPPWHVVENSGYAEGFDRSREYEFWRPEWDRPHRFSMSQQHPSFNVWGLYYRDAALGDTNAA